MTLQDKFEKYHRDNPRIYQLFEQKAKEARKAGFKHYSIWAIANVVRWQINIETRNVEGFKISNGYLSFYSRLIMKNNIHLEHFFRTKERKHG